MSEHLLPCPFCGRQPETYWDYLPEEGECYAEGFNIKCCYVHVAAVEKEVGVAKWNTRDSSKAIDAFMSGFDEGYQVGVEDVEGMKQ